jgi:hypothetical protein
MDFHWNNAAELRDGAAVALFGSVGGVMTAGNFVENRALSQAGHAAHRECLCDVEQM